MNKSSTLSLSCLFSFLCNCLFESNLPDFMLPLACISNLHLQNLSSNFSTLLDVRSSIHGSTFHYSSLSNIDSLRNHRFFTFTTKNICIYGGRLNRKSLLLIVNNVKRSIPQWLQLLGYSLQYFPDEIQPNKDSNLELMICPMMVMKKLILRPSSFQLLLYLLMNLPDSVNEPTNSFCLPVYL